MRLKNSMKKTINKIVSPIDRMLSRIPEWVVNLSMRLVIFKVFWGSVQTKISGLTVSGQHLAFWNITDNTFLLFDFDYGIPFISSTVAAYLTTFSEFFFSLMVLLGFLTRFAALGLLAITLAIQFFVYPDAWWILHVYWVLPLLYLLKHGGSKVSLDRIYLKH